MTEPPDPVNVTVGAQMRRRRVRLGMSQKQLAAALGVSYQQLQKYERGENRVSAGVLRHAAEALRVSVPYFYDEAPAAPGPALADALSTLEGELLANFRLVADEAVRNSVLHLVAALASAARR